LEGHSVGAILIVGDCGDEDVASDDLKIITLYAGSELSTSLCDSVAVHIFAGKNVGAVITNNNGSIGEVRSDDWIDVRTVSRSQDP
jgi:hypothetical protein